jgi:decaprenylphospho-beta-D-ribofuranose 2-oxidase
MSWTTRSYSGWGRALRAEGLLARPERAGAVRGLVAGSPGPLAAIGNLRSYGDAPLVSGGRGILMTRLDRVLGFDPGTGIVEAEAGITLRDLLDLFAPRGHMPPVLPGTGFATLGGAIANDVHGKNHHGAGSFAEHVQSIELLGADGRLRRVSREREKERFLATAGGLGLTGVILSARLRLAACPSQWMAVEERRMPDLDAFMEAFEASRAPFAVGWIDAAATGRSLGRGLIEEADFAPPGLPPPRPAKRRRVPFDAPGALLSRPVVRAFNGWWYRRVPAGGRSRTVPLAKFLFPLDAVADWNRLYGKAGFHQFQCVIPDPAAETLHAMLREVAASGLASPLAVLKRLGAGRAGLMSFPMAGWTLALDLPNRRGAAALMLKLERLALAAGGRLYLAKDALGSPAAVEAMYPELPRFRAILAEIDPAGRFQTDLSRRLGLRAS